MLATFVTLIPLARNDGSPLSESDQEEILNRLIRAFGKLTIEGTVVGVWRDDSRQKTYRDHSLKVAVGCTWDRVGELQELIQAIGKQLGQKEMFVELRSGTGIQMLKCGD